METNKDQFAKQYYTLKERDLDGMNINKNHSMVNKLENMSELPFTGNFDYLRQPNFNMGKYQTIHNNYALPQNQYINEEPIDLTTFDNKQMNNKSNDKITKGANFNMPSYSQESVVIDSPSDYYPRRKRRRRKFAYTADGKLVLVPNDEALQSPASFSESKQLEILKAAKALFSKRTRTLYHWMYPNAAKQQIKAAVVSSWESLGAQEKDFYISQVLGRFGFPQSSLMVNPQLGGIKGLPPIPNTPETKSKSRELQSAISSIMPENPMPPGAATNTLTFEEFEEINELTKKRRGRPPGSSNKKHKFELPCGNMTQDFKDDPELSQELEQFATIFNLSKI